LPEEDNRRIRVKQTCAYCCKGLVALEPECADKVIDLIEALKGSVEKAKEEKEPGGLYDCKT